LALHPNNIGDPSSGKLCKITEGGRGTACNYYVKYSINNGVSWLGLTFSGTPGGTGCPNGGVGASGTSTLAVNWLKTKYIDEGYCGCQDPCGWTVVPTPELFALALDPNNIGDPSSGRLCKITMGGQGTACNYYVKYSIDNGVSWLGLTFSGTPGGTGCPSGGVGSSGTSTLAVNWLKTKYIDEGYCGCQGLCANGVITSSSPCWCERIFRTYGWCELDGAVYISVCPNGTITSDCLCDGAIRNNGSCELNGSVYYCPDGNRNCPSWINYCSWHPWVQANCKLTCNLC